MTVLDLVKYLRLSVKVQDPNQVLETDSKYLSMTDEDLQLFLNIALTRDFPKVPSLDYVTSDMVYPLILLAKKELYHTLAVQYAPLYNMVADNNNQLQRGQMFDHLMKLIGQVDVEYNQYLEDGGAGGNTLTSYDVLLSTRYASKRNLDKAVPPALLVYIDSVGTDNICISWVAQVQRFLKCNVYISKNPIYDSYNIDNKVSGDATKIATLRNAQQNKLRIKGLDVDTTYYILVEVIDMSGLKGYCPVDTKTDTDSGDVPVNGDEATL